MTITTSEKRLQACDILLTIGFGISHGRSLISKVHQTFWKHINSWKKTCPSSLDYIRSSSGLRALVHSHIWVVLGSQVFGRNVWAESRESKSVGPEGRNATSNPFSAWQDYIGKAYTERIEAVCLTKVSPRKNYRRGPARRPLPRVASRQRSLDGY